MAGNVVRIGNGLPLPCHKVINVNMLVFWRYFMFPCFVLTMCAVALQFNQ